MANNSQEFIRLYNTLDELLENRYQQKGKNKSYIMTYALELQKSSLLETVERGRTLNLIRQLRNSLVHDFDMNKDGLIEITPKLIEILKKEIEILSSPKRAIDICTKLEFLLYGTLNDKIDELLIKMVKKGNLQVPILNENNHLLGVLSPNAIVRYRIDHPKQVENLKVEDMLEYLTIDKHISEYYAFFSASTRADEIVGCFDEYYKRGKKLVMIFVTNNGKVDEPILGIITPYDVVNFQK